MASLGALAQEKPKEPPPPRVGRLVQIKNLTGAEFQKAVSLLRMFGVNVDGDQNLRMVAMSGGEAEVKAAEEALKRLDVPLPAQPPVRNIELMMNVVLGSHKAGEARVPTDVEPVIKQMRGVFQFQNYQVLDTLLLRTRDNVLQRGDSTKFASNMQVNENSPMISCSGQLYASAGEDGKIRNFHLDRFVFQCSSQNRTLMDIRTDLDLKEGQKAVVGKSNIDANSAMFLIVSAKQVD
jgi:hypothetical protein